MIGRRDMVMEDGPAEPPAQADPVGAWLDLLERLMRLPAGEAAEVRAELESHLRERARDLMVEGVPEPDAVGRAVAEAGEAAEVARAYRAARHSGRRRMLMNLSMLGVAGSALVVSAVALLRPDGGVQPAVFQEASREVAAGAKLSGSVQDLPLSETLPGLTSGKKSLVRWTALGDVGVERDAPVAMELTGLTLLQALSVLNEDLKLPAGARVAARERDGMIEFATEEYFDRSERVLASYDAGEALRRGSEEQVVKLVTSLAEPESWVDNGGDLSRVHMLGERMFVEAPPRVHAKVKWILEQVSGEPRAGAARQENLLLKIEGGRETRMYPLKHTDAAEVLKALGEMQSIREIDFGDWMCDARSNAIIGVDTKAHHAMVEAAMKALDVEKK